MENNIIQRIADGRTDLVFDCVSDGHPANSTHQDGVALIKWCAYYGDVSAIRFLVGKGESLESLGANLGLNEAVFYGPCDHVAAKRGSFRTLDRRQQGRSSEGIDLYRDES
jgi:hypothetical protein